MRPVLVQLAYSPWSEKARWALDHHHVDYLKIEHLPMVFEPLLRLAAREPLKKQSVPKLFDGREVFGDSLTIARHAESIGSGTKLFPEARLGDVLSWAERSETFLSAARARFMDRMLASREAITEAVPKPLRFLGEAAFATTRLATQFVKQKHVSPDANLAEQEAKMATVLEALSKAVTNHVHLAGDFSFADMAMAAALGFISPRPETPIGPAWREVWHEPRLIAAYPHLFAWRDRIYEAHR